MNDFYVRASIDEIHKIQADSEDEAIEQMKKDMNYKYNNSVATNLNYSVTKSVGN